ncbi:MAG: hypothetical protein JRG91_02285 [Deltaproteobacteria bacterium]|nr:hypothetical protein [Deltaproteobacteria bacterium]
MRSIVTFLLCAFAVPACLPTGDASTGPPPKPCPDSMHMSFEFPSTRVPPVDILVVIDNSMSMAEEQANLAHSFPNLLGKLIDPPRDPDSGRQLHAPVTDIHIGVVSTDMGTGGYSVETCSDPIDGDDGILLHTPNPSIAGCDASYPTYLSSESEEHIDRMATDFGCIATLGIDGCGFEQQLKAGKKALVDHRDGANAGFLRPDSLVIVLYLTDEEDCSIVAGGEGIFDTLDSSLGHLGLRCYHHPELMEPVETYIEALRSLRADPDRLIAAFLVGVPEHDDCLGLGSDIPGCLDHPDMAGGVDPVSMTRLTPTCVTSTGEAYAGRRFVEIAQALGESSIVGSICTDDFQPFIRDLADLVHDRLRPAAPIPPLPVEADAEDPSLCRASCTLVEVLPDLRECPAGRTCVTDGDGLCTFEQHGDGLLHSLCELPQVPTRLLDPGDDCLDATVAHVPEEGAGWYYVPTTYGVPRIRYAGGASQVPGSTMRLSCCF